MSTSNSDPSLLPGPGLFHHLVHRTGVDGANAIEFQNRDGKVDVITYQQLHDWSDSFARKIVQVLQKSSSTNKTVSNQIIPVLIPQSLNLYISLLAILKAGAAFCPLNLDAPLERIKFVANDVSASLVITCREFQPRTEWTGSPPSFVIEDFDFIVDPSLAAASLSSVFPSNIAYVMYTSGSTGTPKGVAISHRAATQSLLAHERHLPAFRRFLQFAAPTFDVSVFEIFFPLYRGATLVGRSRRDLLSNLASTINNLKIDAAELTPTVVSSLLGRRRDVPGLRLLLTIGEMLTKPIIQEYGRNKQQDSILLGMYGPTEAAIHCMIALNLSADGVAGIIGIPFDTVSAYVVAPITDEADLVSEIQVLPQEVVGELAIGGCQLADGYLNREEQTSKSFIDTEKYGRLYRTGDKAIKHADGSFECLGRLTASQIKLRGQRVELGEIEAAAMDENTITLAVVRLIDSVLVLFCTRNNAITASKSVLDCCRRKLPSFMVPSELIFLENVPRLASGKVDKIALDEVYRTLRDRELAGGTSQGSELEQKIQSIVQSVLGMTPPIESSLATLGLDSLRAISIASKLRKAGYKIDVADVLKADSVSAIADLLLDAKVENNLSIETSQIPICTNLTSSDERGLLELAGNENGIEKILPCSPMQRGMIAETMRDHTAYNNWIHLEYRGPYDRDFVQGAIVKALEGNEILRCAFVESYTLSVPFNMVVFEQLPAYVFEDALNRQRPSVVEKDGLIWPLRIETQQFKDRVMIKFNIHHAIYDGWSWDLLLLDMDLALANERIKTRPQFSEVVAYHFRQDEPNQREKQTTSQQYWSLLLQDAVPCNIPSLLTKTQHGFENVRSQLKTCLSMEDVNNFSKRLHVSPQTVFQAAFAYLLSLYCGETHYTFGSVFSGRTLPIDGIEHIIGPCLLTLPIKFDTSVFRTMQDLVIQIHKQNRAALRHQTVPLQQIIKDSNVPAGERLFDAVFIYQESLSSNRDYEKLVQVDSQDYLESNVTLEIQPSKENILFTLNYNKSKWPAAHAALFLQQVEGLSGVTLKEPETALAESIVKLEPKLLSHGKIMAENILSDVKIPGGSLVAITELSEPYSIMPRGAVGEILVERKTGAPDKGPKCLFKGNTSKQILEVESAKKTGTLGRMLIDDSVISLGRANHVARLSGAKIDTAAINQALMRHHKVSEAFTCVVPELRQTKSKQERLLTFWVPPDAPAPFYHVLSQEDVSTTTVNELFDMLEESLPSHMVPFMLGPVSKFPTGTDSRVNPRELIDSSRHFSTGWIEYFSRSSKKSPSPSKALSTVEESIARALYIVIGGDMNVPEIRRQTSFFSLGMDSIMAIRFSRELRDARVGIADVATILKHHNIASLSKVLQPLNSSELRKAGEQEATAIFSRAEVSRIEHLFTNQHQTVESILPCTPLQEAMISSSIAGDPRGCFNHSVLNVLCDLKRLREIWRGLVSSHGIFRTVFVTTEDRNYSIAQVILARFELPWRELQIDESSYSETLQQVMDQAAASIDEVNSPWSITVLRSRSRSRLVLSIHHALYDAAALNRLFMEVYLHYNDQWVPPAVAFSPFLTFMVNQDLNRADIFWKSQLNGFRPKVLPSLLGKSPTVSTGTSGIWSTNFEGKLSDMETKIKQSSMSLLSVCQAAWSRVLCKLINSSDVCFGGIMSGRTLAIEGVERLVAPCFNTLPIRVKLAAQQSNKDLVQSFQDLNANILPFQLTPLRRIQSSFSDRPASLFDTLLLLQEPHHETGWNLWSLEDDIGQIDFPVVLEIIPCKDRDVLQVKLHYYRNLIDALNAQKILRCFEQIIHNTLQYSEGTALDLEFLPSSLHEYLASVSSMSDEGRVASNQHGLESTRDVAQDIQLSSTEQLIRSVFAKLSRVDVTKVQLTTSIFRLGLDSISAVQAATILKRNGLEASSADILEFPSVGALSRHLENVPVSLTPSVSAFDFDCFEKKNITSISTRCAIQLEEIESIRPCTATQNGIISQFLQSTHSTYYNSYDLKFEGSTTDLLRLREAWQRVSILHPMFRSGFARTSDLKYPFAMIIFKADGVDIPWQTVSDFEPLEQVSKLIASNLQRPPWRIDCRNMEDGTYDIRFSALHALFDAQSLQKIFDDVSEIFGGRSLDGVYSIDRTLSQILMSKGFDDEQVSHFWQSFRDKISSARFPSLTPLNSYETGDITCDLQSHESVRSIERKCQELEITVQALCQVAWARVLGEYLGQNSVTFGTVLSGTTDAIEESKAAFPTVVTLPIVVQLNGKAINVIKSVMQLGTHINRYKFTPLSQIQKFIGDTGSALFDTILVFQKSRQSGQHPWELVKETASADYPISIEFTPKDGFMTFRLTARSNMIPLPHGRILLEQVKGIFESLLNYPENGIEHSIPSTKDLLSILPAKEDVIGTEISFLHEFVERNADLLPNKTALEFSTEIHSSDPKTQTWSYKHLDFEGNRVKSLLLDSGVGTGDLVGVCFDKCPEASFGMLGILKSGCAFLAIDPNAPADRRKFILQDSKSHILLTTAQFSDDFEDFEDLQVFSLDSEAFRSQPSGSLKGVRDKRPLTAADPCYCLYTSGTTGKPKGCLISHENAVQALLSFQRLFAGRWDESSRFLQFASFHFDVSILEQYWSWSVGMCVSSAPRDEILEDLPGTIERLRITHIDLTPSLARIIDPKDVPSLHRGVFITGGEKLLPEICKSWGDIGCIFNGYGPTEATIGVTMFQSVPRNGKPSNIGNQFDNVGSYVFRPETTTLVLKGGVGELCVSGKLVGMGYINQQELTGKKFQTIYPQNVRIYRTGDLVRSYHDGSFEFLGRADDQVKLRGQRLETSEINEVIKNGVSSIEDAVTIVIKHPSQNREQLVAFIVRRSANIPRSQPQIIIGSVSGESITAVQDICHQKLPAYMIPTHFVPLSSIPLNANNKADAKQLRKLYEDLSSTELQKLSSLGHRSQEKWSSDEAVLVKCLADFTKIPASQIKPFSTVFSLGLDSITVINFVHLLRESGFNNVTVTKVVQNPTVKLLSSALGQKTNESQATLDPTVASAQQSIKAFSHRFQSTVESALNVKGTAIEAILPCTPLQEGIISQASDSNQPLYFNYFLFQLKPSTDTEILRSAFSSAMQQLQCLRTRFVQTSEGFAQAVLKSATLDWHDITLSATEKYEDIGKQINRSWWDKNRELIKSPFEVYVLHQGKNKAVCVNIFHGIYDGISLDLLWSFISSTYHGAKDVEYEPNYTDVLPYGPLRFNEEAKSFWKTRLTNLPTHKLPSLRDKPLPSRSTNPIQATFTFVPQSLEHIQRGLHTTTKVLSLVAWATVLQKFTRRPTPIGVVVSGRAIELKDADKIIGPMFNTIPFCIDISEFDTWPKAIRAVHEFDAASLPHQQTSLSDIAKWCGRSRGYPLFETLFVFQTRPGPGLGEERQIWTSIEPEVTAAFPISFEAILAKDTWGNKILALSIVAQESYATEEHCKEMLQEFRVAFLQFGKSPQSRPLPGKKTSNGDTNGFPLPMVDSIGDEELPWSAQLCGNPSEIPNEEVENFESDRDIFEWTKEASIIRENISSLANIEQEEVTPHISIFQLGLDSIDTIKLSSRLKVKNVVITTSTIMQHPTVSKMIARLDLSDNGKETDQASAYTSVKEQLKRYVATEVTGAALGAIEAILPATPVQEAIVAEMVASDFDSYLNHEVLQLRPDTNVDQLKMAWRQVFFASSILRAYFTLVDDPAISVTYALVVNNETNFPWTECDLPRDGCDPIYSRIKADIQDRFATVPPFRLTLVRGPFEPMLIVSMSHALYDGWSVGLLHLDVKKAYHDSPVIRPLIEPTLSQIWTSVDQNASQYWKSHLSNIQPCLWPKREVRPNTCSLKRVEKSSRISTSKIESFCRKYGITLQSLGQTCWAFVLAYYTRQSDVVFGAVVSGRETEESREVQFPTMNTIPVRSIIHGTRQEMLEYMQATVSTSTQYQHYPLRKVQTFLSRQSQTFFDTLFLVQRQPKSLAESDPLYRYVGSKAKAEFPVCAELEIVGPQLLWRCACEDFAIGSGRDCDTLLEHLDLVLKTIIKDPEGPSISYLGDQFSVCGLPFVTPLPGPTEPTRTSQGRHALPKVDVPSDQMNSTVVCLRKVMSLVSAVPESEIQQDQTLYHIGLDSISAIKVSSLLRKQNVILPVSTMLKESTIRKMAKYVDSNQDSGNTLSDSAAIDTAKSMLSQLSVDRILQSAGIPKSIVEDILPVTAGQLYMLSHWKRSGGTLFYSTFQYKLNSSHKLSKPSLEMAWEGLRQRHQILRTVFVAIGKTSLAFVQVVVSKFDRQLRWDEGHSTPSNLNQPPIELAVLNSKQGTISLKIHHALYDGVSLPLLMSDLSKLYESTQLPKFQDTWKTFTLIEQGTAQRTHARSFWQSYLADLDLIVIPTASSTSLKRRQFFCPAATAAAPIITFCKREGLSPHTVFLTVCAQVLAALHDQFTSTPPEKYKQTDILLAVYLANRSISMIEGDAVSLPAPTLNILPLRIKTGGRIDIIKRARSAQEDLRRLREKHGAASGLWELKKWVPEMRIGGTVNFLSGPVTDENNDGGIFEEMKRDWDEVEDDSAQENKLDLPNDWLAWDGWDSYEATIDFEARIRGNGLDVGVFYPESLEGSDKTEWIIHEIIKMLGEVCS
ncbi:MAG: NRPS [Vezdaea aestivalis]|nr:MAG: NRPS [Vezdaea aestivalis]